MITHLDTMTVSNGSKNVCLFTTSGLISSVTGAQRFVARALMASLLGRAPAPMSTPVLEQEREGPGSSGSSSRL